MAQGRGRGRIARAAVAAALTGAMALGGLIGPVATALATTPVTVTVIESSGTATTKSHVAYQLFTADVNKDTYKASSVDWATGVQDVVYNGVLATDEGYKQWLQEQGIINSASTLTSEETEKAKAATNAAKYIAETIESEERAGNSISVPPDALKDLDGSAVKSTKDGSLANRIAEKLEASTSVAKTEFTSGSFQAQSAGFYLIVPTGATDGADPIYVPVSADATDLKVAIKTGKPTIDKRAGEGTDNVKIADAGMGDAVSYTITTTIPKGTVKAQLFKWEVEDTMPAGLTYQTNAKVNGNSLITEKVTTNGATITFDLVDVAKGAISGDSAATDIDLQLTYTAKINELAGTGNKGANVNSAKLSYKIGENEEEVEPEDTADSNATVITYEIDLLKVAADSLGSENVEYLKDAQFSIVLDKNDNGTADAGDMFLQADGSLKDWAANGTGKVILATDDNGKIAVARVDSGTYIIHEEKSPEGYDTLAADVVLKVVPTMDEDGATITALAGTTSGGNGDVTAKGEPDTGVVTVTIPNSDSDITLPITGMTPSQLGTVAGVVLVAAGAFMVLRRRQDGQA